MTRPAGFPVAGTVSHPMRAVYEWFGETAARRPRPAFGLETTTIDGARVAVRERIVERRPFCKLLRFERDVRRDDPRIILVAPLSGHFAVLMRDTVAALLPDHDVHITDWTDARDVPRGEGRFGLDENIAYVMGFLRRLGPGTHLLGLCQSGLPALAATSLLAAANDPAEPRSVVLISGMIEPRIAPTRVERLLAARPATWFERNVIAEVPAGHGGAGRRVYPAFLQLSGLMMYLARHINSRLELFDKLVNDDGDDPVRHPFYALYTAVMDLAAEFFLDTVETAFHAFALPRGRLTWRGERVEPAAISRAALMTVEGEFDDISAPGQTRAAHDLCANIPSDRRRHHRQAGVQHFGTFHGRRWREEIAPQVRDFIRAAG